MRQLNLQTNGEAHALNRNDEIPLYIWGNWYQQGHSYLEFSFGQKMQQLTEQVSRFFH